MGSLRRRVAVAVIGFGFVAANPAFAQVAADTKATLDDGERAAKAKDWTTAARFYEAANKAAPSAEALDGMANAHYQGGRPGEAYTAYTDWLARYGGKAPAAKKTVAEARLKELGAKTGAVTVTVSEPGAAVQVDDHAVGTSPVAEPLRLAVGARKLRITKDGFVPFEQTVTVATTGNAAITANLVATAAKSAQEPAPVAAAGSAPVKVGTSDAKGIVYLDGNVVGEGSFSGDVPAGPHKLRITRDGYDPFEEDIVIKDKEPYARTVTLTINAVVKTGEVKEVERFDGVYGGFTLMAMFTPGGTGSSLDNDCQANSTPTLASCTTPSGFGGGIGGYVGYSWDPVGIELFVGVQYDQRDPKRDWKAASTDPGFGPDPARFEAFTIRRIGGMVVPRVRLEYNLKRLRLGLAAGAGFDYRAMHLERRTTSKEATEAAVQHDTFSSDTEGYWSPVVAIEPSVSWRITRKLALQVGMQLFFDAPATFLNGKNNPRTNPETNHALGVRGLSTPSYELASDLQVFVGPFLGMQFGP